MLSESQLKQLTKPSRYLGGELNSSHKSNASLHFALAFADTYEIGMSHCGSAILYHILNQQPQVACERVYMPGADLQAALQQQQACLASLENQRPLHRFHILGFTLQYELSFSNVLAMLQLGGIPLHSAQRNERYPLIIAGGPNAMNPEPLADFLDAVVLGDGEEVSLEICHAYLAAEAEGDHRHDLLQRLSRIPGVYIPSLYQPQSSAVGLVDSLNPAPGAPDTVQRRLLPDLDSAPYPTAPIVPFLQTVHNRVAVEVARGCTRGCRFCQAGFLYRPVRERQTDTILHIIRQSLAHTGFDEVSLLSLSTGDYSCLDPLLRTLMQRYAQHQIAVSLPSLRVGSLSSALAAEIKKVRKTGFTLAPEAGSHRLRQVVNKGIEAEQLLSYSHSVFSLGWQLIKLYFMLGLPTETAQDREGILELSRQVKQAGKQSPGHSAVNVAVSTFVPKPHTPFQWEGQLAPEQTQERLRHLQEEAKRSGLRLKWQNPYMSYLEGVLSRGDRQLGPVLARALELGARFDAWDDSFSWPLWQQAFADCSIDPAAYLQPRDPEAQLPWDHLHSRVDRDYLLQECHKGYAGAYTPDCRQGSCSHCGVCSHGITPRFAQTPAATEASAAEPPLPQPAAEQRHHYRLWLAKQGPARFVGHLDFMTLIHRALRRAQLPLNYSQGYHPQPRLGFGDALPLGLSSDAELAHMELGQPLAAAAVQQRLNQTLPPGVTLRTCEALPAKPPSPGSCIASVGYMIQWGEYQPPADLCARINAFWAADSILQTHRHKGKKRQKDLRQAVIHIERQPQGLYLRLTQGSPFAVTAYILGCEETLVRGLPVHKSDITLNATAPQGLKETATPAQEAS